MHEDPREPHEALTQADSDAWKQEIPTNSTLIFRSFDIDAETLEIHFHRFWDSLHKSIFSYVHISWLLCLHVSAAAPAPGLAHAPAPATTTATVNANANTTGSTTDDDDDDDDDDNDEDDDDDD
eukprot:12424690-Karenia_brevis.AAC.1